MGKRLLQRTDAMCCGRQKKVLLCVLEVWSLSEKSTDLIKQDKHRNGFSTKAPLYTQPKQSSQSRALSIDSQHDRHNTGIFSMHSLLVSHEITARLSVCKLNGQKCKRGDDTNMWPALAKQDPQAKQNWEGGRPWILWKCKPVASAPLTPTVQFVVLKGNFCTINCVLKFFKSSAVLLCMQQADSFSSVKGWEIEMLQSNHRGCVQPQCNKITTITGHQQIFGLNACVSTLWPALGLDASVCRWDRKWNTFILWKCRHVCCLHHNASANLQKVTMRKCGKIKMFLATRFCILLEDVLIWFDFLISKFDTFFWAL